MRTNIHAVFPAAFSALIRAELNLHARIHDPDPQVRRPVPWNFSGCSYRSSTKSDLHKHAHHDTTDRQKHVIFPLCSKRFYSRGGLTSHVTRFHASENCYKCGQCKYSGRVSHDLRRHHKAVHLKEKPFKCGTCHNATSGKYRLKINEMTAHSNERRFKCDNAKCKYQTNDTYSFKRHLLLHKKDPKRQFPFARTPPECDFRGRYGDKTKVLEKIHAQPADSLTRHIQESRYPDPESSGKTEANHELPNLQISNSFMSNIIPPSVLDATVRQRALKCPICPLKFYTTAKLITRIQHNTKENRFRGQFRS